jgi:hypothetical protein
VNDGKGGIGVQPGRQEANRPGNRPTARRVASPPRPTNLPGRGYGQAGTGGRRISVDRPFLKSQGCRKKRRPCWKAMPSRQVILVSSLIFKPHRGDDTAAAA